MHFMVQIQKYNQNIYLVLNMKIVKEIKSLAIEYKDDKDIEIKKLNEELDNFKKTIEELMQKQIFY